jgi:hypothetical protein
VLPARRHAERRRPPRRYLARCTPGERKRRSSPVDDDQSGAGAGRQAWICMKQPAARPRKSVEPPLTITGRSFGQIAVAGQPLADLRRPGCRWPDSRGEIAVAAPHKRKAPPAPRADGADLRVGPLFRRSLRLRPRSPARSTCGCIAEDRSLGTCRQPTLGLQLFVSQAAARRRMLVDHSLSS